MGEWRVVRFGDVTENFDPLRVPVRSGDRVQGMYPYYGASGIVDYVHDYIFDGEYLLIAEDGENLRTRKTPVAFMASGKFWVNNHAHVVRGNALASSRFLCYVLTGIDISGNLSGSTQPKLTQASLNDVRLRVPDRETQDSIVEVLGALDDKIALNERISDTSLALGRSVFRQETQAAGAETALGDLATLQYGKALPAPLRRPGSVPVFGCTGQVGFHDTALTQSAHPVVGRKGANAGHVSWLPEPGWIIDTAFYAMPKKKEVSNEVLYFVLDAAGISTLTADSAVPGVNRDVALRHRIRTPALGRLEELAPQAETFLATCQQAARENRTLADLRDTLLPQLITGKLRVKDATRVVEEAV
ncbi:restriction endonuclease subunit S [Streptomyces atroolivaceus]|uniref:restriction endonuclease subunit S n=1 Tax=Streptomyces atroolivaceus TaxID=66869 RepID=UPI003663954D